MNLLFRLFWIALKNAIFKRPITPLEKSAIFLRVLPTDCDLNFHMNNGRYLTVMDIGRLELIMRLGMLRMILKGKLNPVVAGANIAFFKSLNPFEKYKLNTQIVYWDDKWFYIQQQFCKKNEQVAASAIVKVTFLRNGKRMQPDEILEDAGHVMKPPVAPEFLTAFLQGDAAFVRGTK